MNDISNMAYEVTVVLKYVDKNLLKKIPTNVMNFFHTNAKKGATDFEMNPNKELKEQNILPDTKAMLTLLYLNYMCSPEQKIEMEKTLQRNDEKQQEALREKYNPQDLFKTKEVKYVAEEKELMIYKENIFKKLLNKILYILKRKEK